MEERPSRLGVPCFPNVGERQQAIDPLECENESRFAANEGSVHKVSHRLRDGKLERHSGGLTLPDEELGEEVNT